MSLIPGPATSYDTIYTALKRVQGISNWTHSETEKTIISLDLDVCEKVYLLVHGCEDLCNRYIIRLGELHFVFAMVRAIETYIEGSGIDQFWVKLGWFSENTMHQVLSCSRMKIALYAQENTLVTIYILYLRGLITESNEPLSSHENMKPIIEALGSSNFEVNKVAITALKNTLCDKTM